MEDVTKWFNDGENLYTFSQWDEAISRFRNVIEVEPNNLRARLRIGLALAHKGLHEQAIEEYKKILMIDDKYIDAYYNLGWSYYHDLKDISEAVKYWSEVVRLDLQDTATKKWLDKAIAEREKLQS